jgi:CBS domain containing-hemolysin-like protein
VVIDADGKAAGILSQENIAEMMMVENAQPGWRFRRR